MAAMRSTSADTRAQGVFDSPATCCRTTASRRVKRGRPRTVAREFFLGGPAALGYPRKTEVPPRPCFGGQMSGTDRDSHHVTCPFGNENAVHWAYIHARVVMCVCNKWLLQLLILRPWWTSRGCAKTTSGCPPPHLPLPAVLPSP